MSDLRYMTGFGNHFESEAQSGALPIGRNNPQRCSQGLFAEQLNGTAFTMPQTENQRSWLYKLHPSANHKPFVIVPSETLPVSPANPNQMRWDPLPYPKKPTHFIDGLRTFCVAGSIASGTGSGVQMYTINQSMEKEFFYNADGDLLFVPQEGGLRLRTEFGILDVQPMEIAVIQRGIKFQVILLNEKARGYICENHGAHFRLPDRGPIGANALANPRDFQAPTAAFDDKKGCFTLFAKFQGHLWQTELIHSPLDVVAWHGNYVPYKYDLNRFCVINTVSFDHPDPSIFTVLTSPSGHVGVANLDFVIFPPRWMVAEDTFRPPWYHRNIMSEYMGLITGVYDAKPGEGFVPGGGSLHNCMTAHGPDAEAFTKASESELKPERYKNTMAFMFESKAIYHVTDWALKTPILQKDYFRCWEGL